MAGLGRRTHYRKHLTDSILYDLPEPTESERIAKVVATRGSNQWDVRLAASSESCKEKEEEHSTTLTTDTVLAILPTKFRKLVWVKRNDYVIVQTVTDDDDDDDNDEDGANNKNDSGGIRYMITHILYKDQIQHLKSKGLWPAHDPEFTSSSTANSKNVDGGHDEQLTSAMPPNGSGDEQQEEDDDDIVYGDDDDPLLFVNTNRIAKVVLEDSSSSDEDDE